jgi:ribosomal protein S18 acetylase RimI-like enzyme
MAQALAVDLRPPRATDLHAILAIEREAFGPDAFSARQFRYLFEAAKARSFIADCAGNIGGYGTVLLPAQPRPARIYSLAVAPSCRGRGIAAVLCGAMIDTARQRGYTRVRLEVRDGNVQAQRLYERLGFGRIAHLPAGYYADGSAGWRMQLSL